MSYHEGLAHPRRMNDTITADVCLLARRYELNREAHYSP